MPDKQKAPPPDQQQRERALDAARSILVRAPAGSGKTDLLTRRFLRLLSEVNEPGEIVAITFTKAAAAEMRDRILSELEKAVVAGAHQATSETFSMESLAQRALARSHALGWDLLNLPAQLRISTIDSFCREIALQQPILSGLGGSLEIYAQPKELYRRAARRTLEQIGKDNATLSAAIETLLLWRDNSWTDLEDQVVTMLEKRDQWMHDFVLDRDPDWDSLRKTLERPFVRKVQDHLTAVSYLLDQSPGALEEAHALARFACEEPGENSPWDLAEWAEIPSAPFSAEDLPCDAFAALARFLQTKHGTWRLEKGLKTSDGFPSTARGRAGKARFSSLVALLNAVPSLETALAAVRDLPPARYSEEEWEIVRACFTLLRHAAGQLRVVFAETAAADFIEIAQIAQKALKSEDDLPVDAAQGFADGIHHLLVDEFQDTSRRQHQLLAHLIAAWSGREDRTCFVVGDPMQSIYGFREADTELFPRAEQLGLEIPDDLPLLFDSVLLTANFRTARPLVEHINGTFTQIFAGGDGITFVEAEPARSGDAQAGPQPASESSPHLQLHLEFTPASCGNSRSLSPEQKNAIKMQRDAALEDQMEEIVALIRGHLPQMEKARAANHKYRVAVLGRARKALVPVAQALREAAIPFRAVKLEALQDRPEIIDALALARALLNREDRVAWLGVLRAPWCGLSLADLHTLVSADDEPLKSCPVPELLAERITLLSNEGRVALERVLRAIEFAERLSSTRPSATLGTWLEQVWLSLGGAECVDAAARANLDLLWQRLDTLPQGAPDLLGPALDAALEDLKAQPDPAAEIDCGVQLMTIHEAKGLEFEVVIVPDLQAGAGNNKQELLSWLERGLPPEAEADADAGESAAITEFLVAPLPPKGADRGAAKIWVDRVRREREQYEARRILYVAATRAREELHLFARPSYKSADGVPTELVMPRESLLLTAWPAWEAEILLRFDEWSAARAATAEPSTIESLAASGEGEMRIVPPVLNPTRMRRLPPSYQPACAEFPFATDEPPVGAGRLYERHEGGLLSRALGRAVHELFQHFAQLFATQASEVARESLVRLQPRIAANVRASGIDASQANRIAAQALEMVLRAAEDPQARWILAAHADAASEARWTGVVAGELRNVQVDRVFRAGPTPQSSTDDATWWIVDYKTADYKTADYETARGDSLDPQAALVALRSEFAPQLEAYAKVLRNLHGADAAVRGGLYYPRMALLDWWEL
ncbi:MAG: UvrD-helicase domain-containing protein [Terracidiphilus sp.]|jgi:ATP-dependent exoDNAse (exonuclease V) beta subunit